MGLVLKYTKTSASGVITYRRIIPLALREVLGQREFKRNIGATEREAAKNYDSAAREFEALIEMAQRGATAKQLSDAKQALQKATRLEIAEEARSEYLRLLTTELVVGGQRYPLRDREAAVRVAEVMEDHPSQPTPEDPELAVRERMVTRALRTGEVPHEEPTLVDAYRLYRKLRVDDKGDKASLQRLERVMGYMREVLHGNPEIRAIQRRDARAIIDHMQDAKGQSAATVRRYVNDMKAMIGLAIREFDVRGIENPFSKLEIRGSSRAMDERLPFSEKHVRAITERLKTQARPVGTSDLYRIWVLLAHTGCRLAEITGLLADDVVIREDGISYINIQFHGHRRIKNDSSIRRVPLIGDALVVAKDLKDRAVSDGSEFLFPRYALDRGRDAASQALMKHVRAVSDDKRHTNHSLRHTMEDRLLRAGVDEFDRNLILGHSKGSMSERYGGPDARLEKAYQALSMALKG